MLVHQRVLHVMAIIMWEPLDRLKPQDLDDFGAAKVTFAQTQV